MSERRSQLSLTTIINHYTHWFGEFNRALFLGKGLFAKELQLPNPLEETAGFKQFAQYGKLPSFATLKELHLNLCRQAIALYNSKKPFRRIKEQDYALLWSSYEKLTAHLQKIERTVAGLESGILDPLTGLKVPDQLIESLTRDLDKKRTQNIQFIAAIVDIDHLNAINLKYSRDAGDFVLSEIAGRIGQNLQSL